EQGLAVGRDGQAVVGAFARVAAVKEVGDGPGGQVHFVEHALARGVQGGLGGVEEVAVGRDVRAVDGRADVPERQQRLAGHVEAVDPLGAGGDVEQVAARVENQVAVVVDRDEQAGRHPLLQGLKLQLRAAGRGGATG